jgi:hypothetical protein
MRSIVKTIFLAFCLLQPTQWVAAQTDTTDIEIATTLQLLNAARAEAGLQPVTVSASMSEGCYSHARYLALNQGNERVSGMHAHEEDPSLEGYSLAGRAAAERSVIHYVTPSVAVEGWMRTFYHRIPLLQPNLTEVGIGYYRGEGYPVSLVDCISGTTGDDAQAVVYFPNAGQADVPTMMGPEIPHPVGEPGEYGYPITIYFTQYQAITKVTFKLIDAANRPVETYLSTPEAPATYFPQWNTVCAIPQHPLQPDSKYTVSISCWVDGVPFSQQYSFQTGADK